MLGIRKILKICKIRTKKFLRLFRKILKVDVRGYWKIKKRKKRIEKTCKDAGLKIFGRIDNSRTYSIIENAIVRQRRFSWYFFQ